MQNATLNYHETALVVVDVQPDFLPGGALPCHEGDAILSGLAELMAQKPYSAIVATQDWHPPNHLSFASQHPGCQPFCQIDLDGQAQTLWPDHCVQGSYGAQLHPDLNWDRVKLILRKGMDRRVDSYSGFRDNGGLYGQRRSTGLASWLRDQGITCVHLCGLARDYCVLWTAQDAVAAQFKVQCLWNLTRPVTPTSDLNIRQTMLNLGIEILDEA